VAIEGVYFLEMACLFSDAELWGVHVSGQEKSPPGLAKIQSPGRDPLESGATIGATDKVQHQKTQGYTKQSVF